MRPATLGAVTDYTDAQDVSMRPRDYGFEDYDAVLERHIQVKARMERRKDELINLLHDPTLSAADRHIAESRKAEAKADIASVRTGGSDVLFQRLAAKYR